MHARAAATLMSEPGSSAEIGRHLLRAGRQREAMAWLQRAAREASVQSAHGVAAELYERMLALSYDPLDRARMLCELGTAPLPDRDALRALSHLEPGVAALQCEAPAEAAHHGLALARACCIRSRLDLAESHCRSALMILDGREPTEESVRSYL